MEPVHLLRNSLRPRRRRERQSAEEENRRLRVPLEKLWSGAAREAGGQADAGEGGGEGKERGEAQIEKVELSNGKWVD